MRNCSLVVAEAKFTEDVAQILPEDFNGGLIHAFFTANNNIVKSWVDGLAKRGVRVKIIPVAGALDEEGTLKRDEYIRYIDSLRENDAFLTGKRQPILVEHKIAYWWLHECSTHRSDGYTAFTRYLQLSLLKRYVSENAIERVLVVTEDWRFGESIIHSFPECRVSVVDSNGRKPKKQEFGAIKAIIGQLSWGLKALFFFLVLKIHLRAGKKDQTEYGLYSIFPLLWRGSRLTTDDKYKGILTSLKKRHVKAELCLSLTVDGMHQMLGLEDFLDLVTRYRQVLEKHIVIDLWGRASDFILFIAQAVRYGLTGYSITRQLRRVRPKSETGVDVTEYLISQNYVSTLRIPRVLFEARKVECCIRECGIRSFIYYLYEWSLGRAILYRIKGTGVRAIGMQHGPVNLRRLYCIHQAQVLAYCLDSDFVKHMPHPDEVWIEDDIARETLIYSGYPAEALRVVDTGRKVRGQKPLAVSRRPPLRIMIYPTLWDGQTIYSNLLNFLSVISDQWMVSFKPHPRALFNPDAAEKAIQKDRLENVRVFRGAMEEAIEQTDIAVGTISSALEEAYENGREVILLLLPDRYNESTLYTFDDVRKVRSSEELLAFIQSEATGFHSNVEVIA